MYLDAVNPCRAGFILRNIICVSYYYISTFRLHWYLKCYHDDVMKWKHFPRYLSFVRGIHWSPMNSPHKGQWRGALTFPLICAWINSWANNREAGDLRRQRAHYDVTVMHSQYHGRWWSSNVRNQHISLHGIDPIILEYSGFIIKRKLNIILNQHERLRIYPFTAYLY